MPEDLPPETEHINQLERRIRTRQIEDAKLDNKKLKEGL